MDTDCAVLSPLELECWIDAYRIDNSNYVRNKSQILKPILLSVVLEVLGIGIEALFSEGERDIKKEKIDLLWPYLNKKIDPSNYRYLLELFSSPGVIGKPVCDASFVRCVTFSRKGCLVYMPVSKGVATSIEFTTKEGGVRYPVRIPSDFVSETIPGLFGCFVPGSGEFFLDILLNPSGVPNITKDWVSANGYIGGDPAFTIPGLG